MKRPDQILTDLWQSQRSSQFRSTFFSDDPDVKQYSEGELIKQYLLIELGAKKLKTDEARILAKGVDRLPKSQREQALNVVRAMFSQYADYFNDDEG